MDPIFLEIILIVPDLMASGIESRDEIEDPLNEALERAGIGEVTGGGSGMGKSNIDVDFNIGVSLAEAVSFLKSILREANAPRSTVIIKHRPQRVEYPVWE